MKKLIIHIGYHKTGTTFLNRKFFPLHPEVCHLGKPYDSDSPIRDIVEQVTGIRKYNVLQCRALYDRHIKPIRHRKIVSISDGRIVNNIIDGDQKEIPERLLSMTNDVVIIMVIRRQYDYLKSLYVQKVGANNEKKSFNKWFDDNWTDGMQVKKQLDYFDKIQAYSSVLGKDNVGVFIYEQFLDNGKKFTKDLCNFIGLDCVDSKGELDNSERLNQRMTTLHRFITTHMLLRYIAIIIRKILSRKVKSLISNLIFNYFNRFDPKLSSDRLRLLHEHAKVVNNKLIGEMSLDLHRYHYDT
ncbi:hypothetical protein HOL24_03205 [bacterium]|jgi:hypothetical protein|nr:hypothetical protein [bacterium]